ncbi:MAG: hypothetical protein IT285_10695 [Bdellovibrionales bacterium]|nr:hypothetical protein [Bdellovibrionales bacterium]
MAWKPKEKELTREEAIQLARDEVAPFWIGSPPLLVAASVDGGARLFPIHAKFEEGAWLIHFVDPTSLDGIGLLQHAVTLDGRYSRYGIQTLMCLAPVHEHHLTRPSLEAFVALHRIRFPLAVDFNGMIARALEVARLPTSLLIEKGQTLMRTDGGNVAETDARIQTYLRGRDPGLPLHPVLDLDPSLPVDRGKLDLGKEKGAKAIKLKPGRLGFEPGKFYLSGEWTQDAEGVTTSDRTASLSVRCPSNGLAIIAGAQGKTIEAAKVFLEAAGVPAYDSHLSQDVKRDESGEPYVEVREPRLYHALHHLTNDLKDITLRFPAADRVPAKVFGFRFFDQD